MPADFSAAYSLRNSTPDDLAFQLKLYASTRQVELDVAGLPADTRESFLAMQFNAQTTHYTQFYPAAAWSIVECDGVRAGRLVLDRAVDHLHILDIALMPEFRGRGIGTALLRQVLAEAAARHLPLRLFAFTGERAMGLYLRLGFVPLNDDGIHTELVWRPVA